MKPKNIDVIFPFYVNATVGPAGTIRRLKNNIEFIRNRGYNIRFFTLDYFLTNGQVEEIDFSKGLTYRGKIKNLIRHSYIGSLLFMLRQIYNAKKYIDQYIQLKREVDVVVFHEIDTCYEYLKHKHDCKTVCFFHNDGSRWNMFYKTWPKLKNTLFMRYMNYRYDYLIDKLDECVFIAKSSQENFIKENPIVDYKKTVFFHNGIDDIPINDRIKRQGPKYKICCTGTICKRKGQYLIIEALGKLHKAIRDNIELSLIGDGPDLASLKKRVKELHIDNNVYFYGNVPNDKIHDILCTQDIYILMSNNEGLPISIIEAMRAGLPIISTGIAGIPELVSEHNGVLIDLEVNSILQVLSNIDSYEWKVMGQESRKIFEIDFSFKSMLTSYCDMLDIVSR